MGVFSRCLELNNPDSRGLLVYHAYGHLVGYYARVLPAPEVSPGIATMSRPTEHTDVMASSFSMVKIPFQLLLLY